jgi:hypothetical protein
MGDREKNTRRAPRVIESTSAHRSIPANVRRSVSSVAILCLVSPLLAGCAPSLTTATRATSLPTTTAMPSGLLPAFGEWRVAYDGEDSRLHVVTLDGKTDLPGAVLPTLGSTGPRLATVAGASPDGRHIAYDGRGGLTIINLTATDPAKVVLQNPRVSGFDLTWSPDSAKLAYTTGNSLGVADASTGVVTLVPGLQSDFHGRIAGWLDNQRLLVIPFSGSASPSFILTAVEVATGAARTIATIPLTPNTGAYATLSPDRKQALVSNDPATGNFPDHPSLIELVNTTTGQARPLPGIAKTVGFLLYPVAWKAGTQLAAVMPEGTAGDVATPENQSWLLDFAHDTATKLTTGQFCLGWVPGAGTLILSPSYRADANDQQAHPLSAAQLVGTTLGPPVTLTSTAKTFPFLGFVRTA